MRRELNQIQVRLHKLRREFRRRTQLKQDTLAIRGGLLADLQETFNFAQKRLKAVRNEKNKQFWARLVAYIAQTIAYIAKEYDLANINRKLKELEEKFAEMQKKVLEKRGYID